MEVSCFIPHLGLNVGIKIALLIQVVLTHFSPSTCEPSSFSLVTTLPFDMNFLSSVQTSSTFFCLPEAFVEVVYQKQAGCRVASRPGSSAQLSSTNENE